VKIFILLGLALCGVTAYADQYWFDFEFNDPNGLPQGEGWLRRCQPAPFGVVHDGILTYDSNDPHSYDFFEYHPPLALDCGPNELFFCEWRVSVQAVSYYGDPGVVIHSDDAWVVALLYDVDVIRSLSEYVTIPIPSPPDAFHDYMLISPDMRHYELYGDAVLLRQGLFAKRVIASQASWGDLADGASSRHEWDYFRLGVLALPQTGDVNCDGTVSFGDINPFVEVLTQGSGIPGCWYSNADINGDGNVDFGDINPFVDLLVPSGAFIEREEPEPRPAGSGPRLSQN
jgi:hypothetical protein